MTLTIELTAEQEARLAAAARQRGLEPADLARELLTEHLPSVDRRHSDFPGSEGPDPEFVERVRRLRGKYADVGATTSELHRQRQTDKAREGGESG